jgi:hypothetical protein
MENLMYVVIVTNFETALQSRNASYNTVELYPV